MFSYIWPIGLIVLSNVFYQICAKSVPNKINPFASLTVTYLVGMLASLAFYIFLNPNGNLIQEYKQVNWAPIMLGISIIGLEAGYIYAFQVGWPVSTAQIVQSVILACILIIIGRILYHESFTWNKILGIFVCLAGLYLINMK